MARGSLALVLHAHLPYVRHPEYESFLEERWLFEAIIDTYVPLIRVFEASPPTACPPGSRCRSPPPCWRCWTTRCCASASAPTSPP